MRICIYPFLHIYEDYLEHIGFLAKYGCLQYANFLRRLFGVSNLLWFHRLVEGIINSNKFVVEICAHTCGIVRRRRI